MDRPDRGPPQAIHLGITRTYIDWGYSNCILASIGVWVRRHPGRAHLRPADPPQPRPAQTWRSDHPADSQPLAIDQRTPTHRPLHRTPCTPWQLRQPTRRRHRQEIGYERTPVTTTALHVTTSACRQKAATKEDMCLVWTWLDLWALRSVHIGVARKSTGSAPEATAPRGA